MGKPYVAVCHMRRHPDDLTGAIPERSSFNRELRRTPACTIISRSPPEIPVLLVLPELRRILPVLPVLLVLLELRHILRELQVLLVFPELRHILPELQVLQVLPVLLKLRHSLRELQVLLVLPELPVLRRGLRNPRWVSGPAAGRCFCPLVAPVEQWHMSVARLTGVRMRGGWLLACCQ